MCKGLFVEQDLDFALKLEFLCSWTELPGVCMRNEVVANNMPLKVR